MPELLKLIGSRRVNTVTTGSQTLSRVDMTVGGDTMVVWRDVNQSKATHIGLDGVTIGTDIPLPDYRAVLLEDQTTLVVYNRNIAPLDQSAFYELTYQRYDFNGNPIGSRMGLGGGDILPLPYSVGTLEDQRVAVAYVDEGMVRVKVTGAGNLSFDVASVTHFNSFINVEGLKGGSFVVSWGETVEQPGGNVQTTVHNQVYSATGVAIGARFDASQGTVEALADGGYAFASGHVVYILDSEGQQRLTLNLGNATGLNVVGVDPDFFVVTGYLNGSGFANVYHASGFQVGNSMPFSVGSTDSAGEGTFVVGRNGTVGGSYDVFLDTWQFDRDSIVLGTPNNDVLSALDGDKALVGLGGDDRYYVDNMDDSVTEQEGGGFDRILAAGDFGIYDGNSIEQITTTDNFGTAAITLVGNSFGQAIYGNAGNNTLVGNGGGDVLVGFGGNDDLYINGPGDTVRENVGGGTDRVFVSNSYTLNAGQEIEVLAALSLTATTALNLTGNEFAQTIYGNNGANILEGGGGGDVLSGLDGNDTYIIRDVRDSVRESPSGSGGDKVLAAVDFRLTAGQEVEFINAIDTASTAPLLLAGNEFHQEITGNAGANTLIDGGGVGDLLMGLGGDDFYYVGSSTTLLSEGVGGGNDRVFASVDFTLGANNEIEKLTTANNDGTEGIDLTGNGFANQLIYGNAGANQLNGGGGGDQLIGLGGDDRYVIVNANDRISEAAGGGNDRVLASVDYRLNANAQVEVLSTTDNFGTSAISITGNEYDQSVYGNAGDNVLGGGGGRDTLIGMGGADKYLFDAAPNTAFVGSFAALGADANVARIQDMGVDDKIWLKGSVFGLTPGALPAGAFNTGTVATDADDRILYDPASQALLFDADGAGGANAMLIAFIHNPFNLDASFIQVV